jgi:DNA-binding transcriptional ArsR family regulator
MRGKMPLTCVVEGLEDDFWRLIGVFESNVRRKIIRLLLRLEWRSLSDIAERLQSSSDLKISLPGLLKHMKQLEEAGIVRQESGIFAQKPDARKTIYSLGGKKRVEQLLNLLEGDVRNLLQAGVLFNETSKLARRIQGVGPNVTQGEIAKLKGFLRRCDNEDVHRFLAEDEMKKLKLWRMMIQLLEE